LSVLNYQYNYYIIIISNKQECCAVCAGLVSSVHAAKVDHER